MESFDNIKKDLKNHILIPTIQTILQKAQVLGCWELSEQVESIWTTYQQMLQFMLNGIEDPQAENIRKDICSNLETIVCKLERRQRLKDNGFEKYVSTVKSLNNIISFEFIVNQLEEIATLQKSIKEDGVMRDSVRKYTSDNLNEQHESALLNLFNWTWTGDIWNNNDLDQANRIIFSNSISSDDKAIFISAVTLSILEQYDPIKLVFLLDCSLNEDNKLSQRALVGFILAFHILYNEACEDEEINNRLTIYKDDRTFVNDYYATITQLQLSATTDSVSSKMHNDILPILMQGHMQRMKKDSGINIADFTKNGENPEWIDEAKLDKTMHEMANLQLDGADVYFSTFSGLKSNAFFSILPHWFYPFNINSPSLPDITALLNGNIGKVLKLMLNGSPFCDSDKYSLCYTFKSLGSMAESVIESQISQQLSETENLDVLVEDAQKAKKKKTDIRRHYIFDLYRFFHIYTYHNQFTNPFKVIKDQPITPFSNKALEILLGDDFEQMAQYADFLMRKEYYEDARNLFEKITRHPEQENANIYQKYGFCLQKTNNSDLAIKAYQAADELKPNSKWTLSHLAALYTTNKDYQSAIHCYTTLLDIEPENIKYLQNIGKVLIENRQYEEATKYLYKVNYLTEGSLKAIILLGWALLFSGEREKAYALIDDHLKNNKDNELSSIKACLLLLNHKNREARDLIVNEIDKSFYPDLRNYISKLVEAGEIEEISVTLLFDNAYLANVQ